MIRDTILQRIADTGQTSPREIIAMGFHPRVTSREFNKLAEAGLIVGKGSSRDRIYTAPLELGAIDEAITLPDLPEALLLMMGYTNRRPVGAYKVQGYMSRGFE